VRKPQAPGGLIGCTECLCPDGYVFVFFTFQSWLKAVSQRVGMPKCDINMRGKIYSFVGVYSQVLVHGEHFLTRDFNTFRIPPGLESNIVLIAFFKPQCRCNVGVVIMDVTRVIPSTLHYGAIDDEAERSRRAEPR
jgi:hypothetical protein